MLTALKAEMKTARVAPGTHRSTWASAWSLAADGLPSGGGGGGGLEIGVMIILM